jgi:hypothetical protein
MAEYKMTRKELEKFNETGYKKIGYWKIAQ